MKLLSIEPTPSPNTMKLNMDERVERGRTFDASNQEKAPAYIRSLLAIADVKSIFQTADFIALDRYPKGDWQKILAEAARILGSDAVQMPSDKEQIDDFTEARVYVQTFRGIPMQIRVKTEWREVREALPERFVQAAMEAGMSSPNLIRERKLEDHGVRYGELADIANEMKHELDASFSEERLQAMVEHSRQLKADEAPTYQRERPSLQQALAALESDDWKMRYHTLEALEPTNEMLPVLEKAMKDEHVSVRRLAVVWLGEIGGDRSLTLLCEAMKDASPVVRRTAGDTLSDLGDVRALPTMIETMQDKNKLVRWRAARFLFDLGDERALPALKIAAEDPEFEVALQAKMALERIEGGHAAEGTVWQQMTKMKQDQRSSSENG